MNKIEELLQEIQALLLEKKVEDIISLNLMDKVSYTDYFVLGTVKSSRQLNSIAQTLTIFFKSKNIIPIVDGDSSCDWIIIDAIDIIVHLFKPEAREFYALEKIWHNFE